MWIDSEWTIRAEQKHFDAAKSLIRKITPDATVAEEICLEFQRLIKEQQSRDAEAYTVMDDIRLAGDWKSVYFVDWKDTETFVDVITVLAKNWGCKLTLPNEEDDPDAATIPGLIFLAHERLAPAGLGLWSWNTNEDNYVGWIGRLSDGPFFEQVAAILNIEISQGNADF